MISKKQVIEAQKQWSNGVIKIGSLKNNKIECEKFTNDFLDSQYAFNLGDVLFKPTKCSIKQFRLTKSCAISYFIAVENREYSEDHGFAITPWTKIRFKNIGFILEENRAIAMGNCFFTDLDGNEIKTEYTFGYKLINGKLKIDLHHSSIPYNSALK